MPLMNQSVYFSLQSTHDHERSVMIFSLSLSYDGTNKRLREAEEQPCRATAPHRGVWGTWCLSWEACPTSKRPQEDTKFPGFSWPGNTFESFLKCGEAEVWAVLSSNLTGLRSLSRPGFDQETPPVPRTLESYGAWEQSYWVECVNFRINKGRLLSSNT